MFPHTITIYRHSISAGRDVITKQVISGFYWYGSQGIAQSGKGAAESDTVTIIASPETTADHGRTWDIKQGDRVVKGEGPDVTTLKDILGAVTVLRVDENICGSTVDNITIAGR